jgi:hypothetical protein
VKVTKATKAAIGCGAIVQGRFGENYSVAVWRRSVVSTHPEIGLFYGARVRHTEVPPKSIMSLIDFARKEKSHSFFPIPRNGMDAISG